MSKIALAPNASGTGTLSIASPSTNSDYTLTLPAETGTVLTSGGAIDVNASAPADSLAIDSSGNVAVGTATADGKLTVAVSDGSAIQKGVTIQGTAGAALGGYVGWQDAWSGDSYRGYRSAILGDVPSANAGRMRFFTADSSTLTERMRIDSSGNLLVGTTDNSVYNNTSGGGIALNASNEIQVAVSGATVAYFNRMTSDGTIVSLRQAGTEEGTISVSGTTVSYNGGHLARYAQTVGAKDDTLVKGTVLSNLDEMNVYIAPTTYWTEEDELPVDEEGNPTVAVGDVKVETHEVQNEQLNKVKVSDVEGDVNVAGVFVNWSYDEAHSVDEINMAMTGDMIIRIAQGVTVQRGDLLMSAGDGTAKPQEDDIVRSKTIAKVTSTNVTCTYEDGSYCVPCVLMAC